MSLIVETAENQKKELYQTHYYKASYDQLKELYLEVLKELKHNIISVNDDYCEIFSEIPHMSVTAKIVMQNPKETSIDFYIVAEFMFGNKKKLDEFIDKIYNEITKKYELKGLSLHK